MSSATTAIASTVAVHEHAPRLAVDLDRAHPDHAQTPADPRCAEQQPRHLVPDRGPGVAWLAPALPRPRTPPHPPRASRRARPDHLDRRREEPARELLLARARRLGPWLRVVDVFASPNGDLAAVRPRSCRRSERSRRSRSRRPRAAGRPRVRPASGSPGAPGTPSRASRRSRRGGRRRLRPRSGAARGATCRRSARAVRAPSAGGRC